MWPAIHLLVLRQEDVFKSISDNVGESGASGQTVLALMAGLLALVILVALLSRRSNKQALPAVLHHHGKLLKEVVSQVPLRPAEMKNLKILAENPPEDEEPLENPLVMVLCPSLLVKAMANRPAKVDKRVIAELARKMGLNRK